MANLYQPPTKRLKTKRRPFEEVIRDIRYAVFSVIRLRPTGNGDFDCAALGSGFFVSHEIFLTCHHVVNSANNPHIDGDTYRLIALTDSKGAGMGHDIVNVVIDQNLHLFRDSDLALLRLNDPANEQPFVALEYGDVPIGRGIGVAGYPLSSLAASPQGDLLYNGLVFRVARGVITSTYSTTLNLDQQAVLANIPVLEVNFLFVPGNARAAVQYSTPRRAGLWLSSTATRP
jgi:hypothetical protein